LTPPRTPLDTLTLILAAFGGVAVAMAAGLREVVRAWCDRWVARIRATGIRDGLQSVAVYFGILDELKRLDFVDRVLLLVGHNGGGVPKPGEEYTVRSFYGYASNRAARDPSEMYRNSILVDRHYIDMLLAMLGPNKKVVNTTAEMPRDAALRHYYEAEGVAQSVIFFIKVSDNNLYYLSVGTYGQPFTDTQMFQIEMAVQQLRVLANQ